MYQFKEKEIKGEYSYLSMKAYVCDLSLDLPHRGRSNEGSQHMLIFSELSLITSYYRPLPWTGQPTDSSPAVIICFHFNFIPNL